MSEPRTPKITPRRRFSSRLLPAILAFALEATPAFAASPGQLQPGTMPTLPPAQAATRLPYPAYGPTKAGIQEGVSQKGIPSVISLPQAVAVAVATSPSLAAARADVGIAQAAVRLARTGILPNLSATVDATHSYFGGGARSTSVQNNASGIGSATTINSNVTNQQSNSADIALSQLIFDGGRTAAGIRAARLSESSSVHTYQRALQTLSYNVATAYYQALAAERTTQVDMEIVREDQQQLSLVQAQVRAGTAALVDQVTTELPVVQARVAVIQAQGAQIAALAAFSNVLGLNANIAVQPLDDGQILQETGDTGLPAPTYVQSVARAQALRPDLAASKASLEAAYASLREAKLGLFPRLSGDISHDLSSTTIGGGVYSHTTSIGATLSIPFYDQGATSAGVAQAKANVDLASANYQVTELGVQLAVRQSLAQLISAQAALAATRAALYEASEVLRSTQAQYRAGVTTLPQLLNAQVGMTQALVSQINAVYTLRQAEQAFRYAVGEDFS